MAIVLIMRRFIICIFGVVLSLIFIGCSTTSTLVETMQKTQKEEVKTGVVNHYITKDSIVYRERIFKDTVYVEKMRFKTLEVHDTSFIYFAVSDTVYVDKMVEKQVVKTQYKTPFYIYIIIGTLIMIIVYLTIKKLFH